MSGASDFVDDALNVLGGEDTEFWVTSIQPAPHPLLKVTCCYDDCQWGYTIGQMPVWEIAADCRDHWENEHV